MNNIPINVNLNIKKFIIALAVYVSVQIMFAILNPYRYFEVAVSTYIHYFIYFICGSLSLALFLNKRPSTIIDQVNRNSYSRNQKLLALIYAFPSYIAIVLTSIFVLRTGINLQELRNLFFYGNENLFSFGDIALYLSLYIGLGYYLFISYITKYKIYSDKVDRDTAMIVGSGLFAIDAAAAGRMAFFYMALVIISTSLLFTRSKTRIFEGRLKKKIIIVFCIFMLIFISRVLVDPSSTVLSTVYGYMVGPIFLMDQGLKDPSGLMYNEEFRFGASLMTFDWAIVGILKKAGYELKTLFVIADGTLSTGYYLNNTYGMNAHFTAPFYFLIDYGYLSGAAIFVYSSIILLISKVKRNVQCHSTIAIFLSLSLFLSSRENIYNSPAFMFTLFLLLFFPMKPHSSLSEKA